MFPISFYLLQFPFNDSWPTFPCQWFVAHGSWAFDSCINRYSNVNRPWKKADYSTCTHQRDRVFWARGGIALPIGLWYSGITQRDGIPPPATHTHEV